MPITKEQVTLLPRSLGMQQEIKNAEKADARFHRTKLAREGECIQGQEDEGSNHRQQTNRKQAESAKKLQEDDCGENDSQDSDDQFLKDLDEVNIPTIVKDIIKTHPFSFHHTSLELLCGIPLRIPTVINDTNQAEAPLLGERFWIYSHSSIPGSITMKEVALRSQSYQDLKEEIGRSRLTQSGKEIYLKAGLEKIQKRFRDRRMRYQWRIDGKRQEGGGKRLNEDVTKGGWIAKKPRVA
ncbi:hypothetical protein BDZ91DRAFT_795881 [Kalaharituber pfeilii]|nr:hypothetical protein BDZ91DRAFT_795881 [Kalaharituber pfeilii]